VIIVLQATRSPRQDRTGRRGPRQHRRDHPAFEEVQVRHAVHVLPGRAARTLAARVIQPGDPVLRVKADASIVSVIALFPFGLTKSLRYLKGEDTWQTRFLAPVDMADGVYSVRLVLRDRNGGVYRESKTFVIASHPPVLRARLERSRVHAGETVRISAQVSGTARTITARMYGALPVALHWNGAVRANTGEIAAPANLPPGRYTVHVTAEDIAHNIGTEEVALEIW